MRTSVHTLLAAILFTIVSAGLPTLAQQKTATPALSAKALTRLKTYQPVTSERLKAPEDSNWLAIRRTYDGWGFSPLTQITTANVSRLRPVWNISTGEGFVHEAAPIVNNGVMFVSTPNNLVLALDAKSGALLWRYKRERPKDAFVLHQTNRGVARSMSPPAKRCSSRSTPGRARKSGRSRSLITSRRTTRRWLHSSPTAK
jgi:glucose dehydrogenase